MSEIAHDSIFEFLSLNMGVPEANLLSKLAACGVNDFMQYIKESHSSIINTDSKLSKDITDVNGKTLISCKAELYKHLPVLFERYIKEPGFKTSELYISADAATIKMYQKVLRIRLLNMYESFILRDNRYGDFVKMWLNESEAFNNLINLFFVELVSSTDGINKAIEILRLDKANNEVLKEASTMLTFTLKVTQGLISRKVILLDNKKLMMKLIGSGFFFYFLLRKIQDNVAEITDEEKEVLLSYYKDLKKSPVPLFLGKNSEHLTVRVLITIHVFIALLEKNNLRPNSMDAGRLMLYLSDAGFTDYGIVSVLSEIFLPKTKHSLLQYAVNIKSKCVQRPVIWGIAGDMMPIRMICSKHDCQHASHHKTYIPSDIKISADMVFCTNIKGGIYYKCNHLTSRMEDFFKKLLIMQSAKSAESTN